jgi:site-specific recombinase XerD
MTLEDIVRSSRLRALARQGPLGPHIDSFVASVTPIGYTPDSLRDLLYGVIHFGAFLRRRRVTDLRDVSTSDVDAFVAQQPIRCCQGKYRYRISRGVRGARHLLGYARAMGIAPPEPPAPAPPYAPLLDEWIAFLEHHRGLAPKSLALYRRHLWRFLEYLAVWEDCRDLRNLDVNRVHDYVRRAVEGRSRSERKAVVSTLRIFLSFAWDRGYLTRDLSNAIERVPSFKHERLPRGPRWEDAQRLLDTPDCRTALGRRDRAILQILLAYGVRGQQVCRLLLDDIAWRDCSIHFAALKGGRPIEVPLLPAVGEAVAAYLRDGRSDTDSRHVFLSTRPPFPPLAPSTITSIVARAFAKAQIRSPHRGSHALRHAWATRLLAEGRSLKVIADLLGHRSLETTRLYAKVDFERLRTVGLPWPGEVEA